MKEYIPLSELPSLQDFTHADIIDRSLPPMVWEFNIPTSVDVERIQLDTSSLALYQKVGALGSSIVLEHQGDRTEYSAGINGINFDGTASATRVTASTKADKSTASYIDPIDIPRHAVREFGRPILVQSLNKAELAQNISEDVRNGGYSREEAWGRQLDSGLRDSFRKGAREHLVDRVDSLPKIADYAFYSMWGVACASELAQGHSIALSATGWGICQSMFTGLKARQLKRETGSTHLAEKRWSLFYNSHQSDRYWALNALSRVTPLIHVKD